MYKRLKECKSLREIFEVIPEEFYEQCAMIISGALFLMVVLETLFRYITRHQTLMQMQLYFRIVGYAAVIFAIVRVMSCFYKVTKEKRIEYFVTHLWDVCLILFLLVSIISAYVSGDFKGAFQGHWMRMCGIRTFFMIAGLYICGKSIKSNKNVRTLWWMFVFTSTVQGGLIFSKYIGIYGSYCGGFYNSNHAGYFMCMAIMAAEAIVMYEKNKYGKLFATLLMGINIWILIINNTFGSYLAVLCAMLFMVVITLMGNNKKSKYAIGSILLFICISVAGELQTGYISDNFFETGRDVEKVADKSQSADSVGTGRGMLWKESIEAIKTNPVIGYGPDLLGENVPCASEPHNEFLQIGAEEGMVGLFLYTMALISLFINRILGIKKMPGNVIGGAGIVVAYIVSSMFGVIFFYTFPFYFFFLGNVSVNCRECVDCLAGVNKYLVKYYN